MFQWLTRLFGGNKSEKDIRRLLPIQAAINKHFAEYQNLDNDELRQLTVKFRQRIQQALKERNDEIAQLRERAENEHTPFEEQEELYRKIDQLEKERDKQLEEVLNELLPEAFAAMKETARRFTENEELVVTATDLDRDLATRVDYVVIDGDKARYKTTWAVRGIPLRWNMVHYDVQLLGGIVLHQGKIAEMATGEGKTLVSTLPAYLNALAGLGVHIVTVNDYLSRRDCEWNRPLFNFLGITVDCIDYYPPHSAERRRAYQCDITYGTNNEFGFDYLRDNMARTKEELVQRKLHYAMVDEVDSVLIDDARTPLIISGPVPRGDDQLFHQLKPRVVKLVEAQKKAVNSFLNEAKRLIEAGKTGPTEGGLALLRAYRGMPKYGNLVKYLSEEGIKSIMLRSEAYHLADNQKEMPKADAELYFVIDEKHHSVELTEKGIELITEAGEDKHFFVLPDVGAQIAEIERSNLSDEEKLRRKDELLQEFAIKSERIHTVHQLLKAYCLYERDVEYVVIDGKVKIVDEQTGRILEGRRYSDGLHQAIEAKENVKVEAATQTFATITLQNYFRMYHKLAGMTGTAETEAAEFWKIYKLDVVVIPTHLPVIRKDFEDLVYKTKREKYKAVINEIVRLHEQGRPVLVGTTSVEVSELLSRMLKMRNLKHNVLNAKHHQREAEIIAEAGMAGAITIATNMAGRGTDIKLGAGVKEAGGLAIIGTERHESRRVDRQLRGRAGRQGDPGTSQFFVSLEDDLMRLFGSDRIARIMDRLGYKEDEVIQHPMITRSIERAQKKVEENNFGIRKRLLEYDDVMNAQREVIYKKRRHALFGDRLSYDLHNMMFDLAEELVQHYQNEGNYEGFRLDLIRYFSIDTSISQANFSSSKATDLAQHVYQEAVAAQQRHGQQLIAQTLPLLQELYQTRGSTIQNVVIPFTDGKKVIHVLVPLQRAIETEGREIVRALERTVTLAILDEAWKEHLRDMDDLKQAVQNAVYEQKDPLLIYKFEAFNLFKKMLGEINRNVISFLFKSSLPQMAIGAAQAPPRTDYSRMREGRGAEPVSSTNGSPAPRAPAPPRPEPVRVGPKVGRNDPCPCGSGKKYKNCHGRDL
ncbi:MAG: preprotein translocase subunit SecA [Chitinophagales bacterium]|nr:preprotein translocase subunit SecA [Chitinophagales bacterium]MDW8426930.1 preprotein translocase subunit SecA [Chitinophagales bacterium]